MNTWRFVVALVLASVPVPDDDAKVSEHLARGRERAKARDWAGASGEFEKASALRPGSSAILVELGNARGELGAFSEARDLFEKAAKVAAPDDPEPRYRVALASIALGDEPGYRRACEDLVSRFAGATSPKVASPLAYTGSALPRAVSRPEVLVRWGEASVPLFRGNERVLGATLYRAGRFEEGLKRLEESASRTSHVAWDWLFLALCHEALGHRAEAEASLKRAEAWIVAAEAERSGPPGPRGARPRWHSWNERAEVAALRREAESAIRRPGDRPRS